MFLKSYIRKLLYGYRHSSESFVKYLRKGGAEIGNNTYFFNPRKCTIDMGRLDWIKIGSNSKFSSPLTILAHDYSFSVLISTHGEILQPGGNYTSIGSNVFTGVNVTILSGITIGDNVIIGANSVVTKNIPSNTVYAGSPARKIMTIEEYYLRRKAAFYSDAERHAKHVAKQKRRVPTSEEMDIFALLYIERTEQNWNRYIKNIKFPGNDIKLIESIFWESVPIFDEKNFFDKIFKGEETYLQCEK